MIRRPPRSTRTDTLFPYTTLFRSEATCTGSAPSGVKLDGLRRPTGKPDTLPADLAPMGLDPRSWPRTEGSERVGRRTLLALRDWADNHLVTAGETERPILHAAAFLEPSARVNHQLARGAPRK